MKRNRWMLAVVIVSLGLLAALVARADTRLEPGMPCYEAAAAGYARCAAEYRAWATTAEERAFVARAIPEACQAYAGIWYDHCRWDGACRHE